MAIKALAVICSFAIFNAAQSQVLNRLVPGFGQLLPETVIQTNQILPNQFILPNQIPNFLAPNLVASNLVAPNLINYELPCGVETVLSAPVTVPATTTIIQDSTVANNLANALQLLVVSNLLSNTLPYMGSPDLIVPGYGAVDVVSPLALGGLPAGYSYVY